MASILEIGKKYCNSPDFLLYYCCYRLLLLPEGQAARLLPGLLDAELEWVGGASPSQRASAILRAALDKDFINTFATLIAKARGEEVRSPSKFENARSEREFLMNLLEEESAMSCLNLSRTGPFYSRTKLIEPFLVTVVGIDISLTDGMGNTALHLIKDPEFAEELLERAPGALNIKNGRGETPLESALGRAISASWAERESSFKLVQIFLRKGAALPSDADHTLLRGLLEVVSREYSFGLSIAFKWLINEGIDWQSITSPANLLEAVLDTTAASNCGEVSGSALLNHLLAAGVEFARDNEGNTPLHLATDPEFVALLIECASSLLQTENDKGETPFESALERAISTPAGLGRRDLLELVQVFLQKGAAPPPDENHALLREFLKAVVRSSLHGPVTLVDMVRQLIDIGIDWQRCASTGDLLKRVVDTVAAEFNGDINPLALIDLLFSIGIELELEGLRSVLLDGVRGFDDTDVICAFVRLLEGKKQGIMRDCDSEGEIFWSLMDRIVYSNPYCERFEEIPLLRELLDSGLDLDGNILVDLLKQVIDRHFPCSAYRELMQLFREKRAGLIEACDPNQTLLGCLRHRVLEGRRSPEPEWVGLLLDLGFKPDEAFLEKFLVAVLEKKRLPRGIEKACKRLIEERAAQEGGLSNIFFVETVMKIILAQTDEDKASREGPEDPDRVRRSQFHLQILKSLIDKGAEIPDEINGVPFPALLKSDTLSEEALAVIKFTRRSRLTKSARGKQGMAQCQK